MESCAHITAYSFSVEWSVYIYVTTSIIIARMIRERDDKLFKEVKQRYMTEGISGAEVAEESDLLFF